MKKQTFIMAVALLLAAVQAVASPIGRQQARAIARNFCAKAEARGQMRKAPSATQLTLAHAAGGGQGNSLYYAFNRGQAAGYVIVSGDDRAPQILGYADSGTFDTQRMPENMRWWLGQYERQLRYMASHPEARMHAPRKAATPVQPLLGDTEWDQEAPYNNLCPYISYYDRDYEETYSGVCPTGCVATALAQVMRYHRWPDTSHGTVEYQTETAKTTVTADLNATYDWDLILPSYGKDSHATAEQKAEVAKLCFNVGASLESDYTPIGTGAYDVIVCPTLIRYFNYDKAMRCLQRDYTPVADYEQTLIDELLARRPVPYGGVTRENAGHFFVLDGIDADGLYHINWGWGGMSNGYFTIAALDPDEQGVGGSESRDAFKYHQVMIAGMQKPQDGSQYDWYVVCDGLGKLNTTVAKDETVTLTYSNLYNESPAPEDLKYELYWTLTDAQGQILYRKLAEKDTLQWNEGYSSGKTKFSIPDEVTDGQYQLLLQYYVAEEDFAKPHRVQMLAGGNTKYRVTVSDEEATYQSFGKPQLAVVSLENTLKADGQPAPLKAGEANRLCVTFQNDGGDYLSDMSLYFYIKGMKYDAPTFSTKKALVAVQGEGESVVGFDLQLPSNLAGSDNYVLEFRDGDSNILCKTTATIDGGPLPASLYIEDRLTIENIEDGVAPMNHVVLCANISNSAGDFYGPLEVRVSSKESYDYVDFFETPDIHIPAGSEGTDVRIDCHFTELEVGKTYTLSLYNLHQDDWMIPSYNNKVTFTAGEPVEIVEPSGESHYTVTLQGNINYRKSWDADDFEGLTPMGIYQMQQTGGYAIEPWLINSAMNANGGGQFVGDKFYYVWNQRDPSGANNISISQLNEVDLATGQRTNLGICSDYLLVTTAGTAVDPTTGQVYGIFWNENHDTRQLGIVDYPNMKRTTIATVNQQLYALCCDNTGQLYAIDTAGNLCRVDKETAAVTIVGNTGFKPKYGQAAAVDAHTNKMYWTAFDGKRSLLMEVDLQTATATQLAEYDDMEEFLTLRVLPPAAADKAPAPATDLTATFEGASKTGTISFRLPKETFDGSPLSGQLNYKVNIDGQNVKDGSAEAGEQVTFTHECEGGETVISVLVSNAEGQSPEAGITVFVGNDTPLPPTDVVLTIDEATGRATLSWTAPTGSVHGGYIDRDNLSYTITRQPDGIQTKNIQDTSFEELLGDVVYQPYRYEVQAVNHGRRSEAATSEAHHYGHGLAVPYSEAFDSEESAAMFTIVDANGDGNTWEWTKWHGQCMYYVCSQDLDADEWLITPPIALEGGKTYTLSFDESVYSASLPEKIEVKYGQGIDYTAYEELMPVTVFTNPDYETQQLTFTPATSGDYFFGFHLLSDRHMLSLHLDNISLEEAPQTPTGIMDDSQYTINNKHAIYDLQGRRIESSRNARMSIVRLKDGTFRKVMR